MTCTLFVTYQEVRSQSRNGIKIIVVNQLVDAARAFVQTEPDEIVLGILREDEADVIAWIKRMKGFYPTIPILTEPMMGDENRLKNGCTDTRYMDGFKCRSKLCSTPTKLAA
jgi:hypothetical protein